MNIQIRPETPADYEAIHRVNDVAFDRSNESKLIENLRQLDKFDARLSLIAELEEKLVGHILFYPVIIRRVDAAFPSLSLGPVAVLPEYQKQGIGGELIRTGHVAAKKLGFDSVILLGHPEYYPRFGYQPAEKWGLTNPWHIEGDPFMALELVEGALAGKAGQVIYPAVFDDAA